ncbi:MAG: hypothetical protein OEM98_08165 [Gammaproteobacteria bacterium]|nr:hypothetical protein [Gammaproteobacteria bacterium]
MGQIDPVRFWAGPIPAFRPEMEYGNGIHLTARPTPEFGAKLVELLYEDMRRHIPPGYRSKVEIVGPRPIDYGRAMGISWRYRP